MMNEATSGHELLGTGSVIGRWSWFATDYMHPDFSTKSIVTPKKYPKALLLIHFSLSDVLNNEGLLPQSRNIPYVWRVAIFRIMSDNIAMISSFDIRVLYRRVSADKT